MINDSNVPPLSLSNERLAHIVKQLSRDFHQVLDEKLQPFEVNRGFWPYLRELWNEEGLSQRELSDRVGFSGPTTNAFIGRMKSADLIELIPIKKGKPRGLVYLTKRGRELRKELEPIAENVNALAVKDMTKEEIELFKNFLLRAHQNLSSN